MIEERDFRAKPGDGWATTDEEGRPVWRVRNQGDTGWDEFSIDPEMPGNLFDAHAVILKLHAELAEVRRKCPEGRPLPLGIAATAEAVAVAPRPIAKSRPCGGCG